MKSKILILANLIQKIAIWKSDFSREDRLKDHIIMLDWVISNIPHTRDINTIVDDVNYELSPEEYFKRFD